MRKIRATRKSQVRDGEPSMFSIIMPNGKQLGDCTEEYIARLADAFNNESMTIGEMVEDGLMTSTWAFANLAVPMMNQGEEKQTATRQKGMKNG